jgi:hypothetical protein
MKRRAKSKPDSEGNADVGNGEVSAVVSGVRFSLSNDGQLTFPTLAAAGAYLRQMGILDLAAI